jgi:hypothetical protein
MRTNQRKENPMSILSFFTSNTKPTGAFAGKECPCGSHQLAKD